MNRNIVKSFPEMELQTICANGIDPIECISGKIGKGDFHDICPQVEQIWQQIRMDPISLV